MCTTALQLWKVCISPHKDAGSCCSSWVEPEFVAFYPAICFNSPVDFAAAFGHRRNTETKKVKQDVSQFDYNAAQCVTANKRWAVKGVMSVLILDTRLPHAGVPVLGVLDS